MYSNNTEIKRATILIVDDTMDMLSLLGNILKETYRVKVAKYGRKAIEIASENPKPDLILLDIMMPEMDGYEVCCRLKENPHTQDIPIIFLTAKTDVFDEEKGLALGAVDYIAKPVSPPIVLARVNTQLHLKNAAEFLKDKNNYLEQMINRRTEEVNSIYEVMMLGLASLAETRDNETGNHIRRTQHYVKALAERLQNHSRFAAYINDDMVNTLFRSAPLHDIGKVGIPDNILLKPGKYNPEEYEIIKKHTTIGMNTIEQMESKLKIKVEFLRVAKEITYSHHEWWNGKGYPQGLVREEIPLSARIMALADVYDAIISRRVYKTSMPHELAVELIASGGGTQFDPDITDAFLGMTDEFNRIATMFTDGE